MSANCRTIPDKKIDVILMEIFPARNDIQVLERKDASPNIIVLQADNHYLLKLRIQDYSPLFHVCGEVTISLEHKWSQSTCWHEPHFTYFYFLAEAEGTKETCKQVSDNKYELTLKRSQLDEIELWFKTDVETNSYREFCDSCYSVLTISGGLTEGNFTRECLIRPSNRKNLSAATIKSSTSVTRKTGVKLMSSALPKTDPVYKHQANIIDRLHTFYRWPRYLTQKPRDLAEAGFFFVGQYDAVLCFFCSGGLIDWRPEDDPWIAHGKEYPLCGYLRLKKGEDFIREFCQKEEEAAESTLSSHLADLTLARSTEKICSARKEEIPTAAAAAATGAAAIGASCIDYEIAKYATADVSSEKTAGVANAAKDDRIPEAFLCKVCHDKVMKVVLLPCAHFFACEECALKLKQCCFCRKKIKSLVRTFDC
jgi:Inhibitor of Apoptosis domain/Zinc finger, C3HC4 type (RING finger)